MEVVTETGAENAEIIQLISRYIESGKGEDFYKVQLWMAARELSAAPLQKEILAMIEMVNNTHNRKEGKKIVSEAALDQTAAIAEMFADEIDAIRADSEFNGTQMQMEYLRDILNCGEKLNTPLEDP